MSSLGKRRALQSWTVGSLRTHKSCCRTPKCRECLQIRLQTCQFSWAWALRASRHHEALASSQWEHRVWDTSLSCAQHTRDIADWRSKTGTWLAYCARASLFQLELIRVQALTSSFSQFSELSISAMKPGQVCHLHQSPSTWLSVLQPKLPSEPSVSFSLPSAQFFTSWCGACAVLSAPGEVSAHLHALFLHFLCQLCLSLSWSRAL